ncbi:MAG TPA: methyltransferase domain-containing protein [Ramlibacter sp.]
MTAIDAREALKQRLFTSISTQVDAIGYVPADITRLLAGTPLESATLGDADARPPGVAAPSQALSPQRLAQYVNHFYDEAFYNRSGTMGLLLGDSEFRNIGYWEPGTTSQHAASERLQDVLLEFIPRKAGSILDVACGMGASTRRLLEHYPADQVWAINISEKQIESTRRNAPGVNAQVMNAVQLQFPDGSFDAIECIEAAFHFETRRRFLEEALRVLRPGGQLVMSDMLFTSAERLAQYPVFPSKANHLGSVEEYRALLEEVGFRDCVVRDASDRIWRPHFLYVVNRIHEDFADGKLGLVQMTEILWSYYQLHAITGPSLLVSARK